MRFILSFFITLIATLIVFSSCSEDPKSDLEPVQGLNFSSFVPTDPIDNQYIVVLHEDKSTDRLKQSDPAISENQMRKDAVTILSKYKISEESMDRIYSSVLRGFCVRLTKAQLDSVKNDPSVDYVEQDRKGMLGKLPEVLPIKGLEDPINTQIIPWGIKRVGGPFNYEGKNSVFIVDTGIQLNHPDLNVCVEKAFDAYHSDENMDLCFIDEHGHGTHVAGTVGALDNLIGVVGVAAGVSVVPVKIFYGKFAEFTYSGMLAGIDHIHKVGIQGDVANLSFGGFDRSRALDEAVLNVSEEKKIWMVIASGNSRLPATSFSPARVSGNFTITVSAIDVLDNFAWFSHYGFPVKFAAPGVNIFSTTLGGKYRYESGTSMAAPHVAGLRVLGEIQTDGFAVNYPIETSDPIASGVYRK